MPEHKLILECYHPSAKISTPYLACRYLGTKTAGLGAIDDASPRLEDLPKMYSSFRPVLTEENRRRRFRPDWPQQSLAMQGSQGAGRDSEDEFAVQEVYLDEGELFSQLCTVTNVVKESARPGFYLSHVNTCDGVIRIWRGWLAELAKSVARRFSNKVMPSERMPLIAGPGDDEAVSYSLVYEGTVAQPVWRALSDLWQNLWCALPCCCLLSRPRRYKKCPDQAKQS